MVKITNQQCFVISVLFIAVFGLSKQSNAMVGEFKVSELKETINIIQIIQQEQKILNQELFDALVSDDSSEEKIEKILDAGANPNAKNENGSTPLHEIVHASQVTNYSKSGRVLQQKLHQKIHLNNDDLSLIKLLISKNAKPGIKNSQGKTIYDLVDHETALTIQGYCEAYQQEN